MKKFLKIMAVIVAVLAVAIIAFVKLFDFNDYKPQIEKLVRKYADVDIKINGDLAVALSLKPTIEINDVTVALPDGQKIANIGNALVQFSVMPLFHKELQIDSLETSGTEIFYDQDKHVDVHLFAADMDSYEEPIKLEFATSVDGVTIDGAGTISSWQSLQHNKFNDTDVDAKIEALGYTLNFKGVLNNLQDKMAALGTYDVEYKNNKVGGNVEVSLAENTPYINLSASSKNIDASAWQQTAHSSFGSWLISEAYAEEYIAGTTLPYSYLQMANADISLDFKKIIVDKDISVDNLQADVSVKNGAFKANIKQAETMGMKINGNVSLDSPKSLPYIKLNIKGNTLDLQKFTAPAPTAQKHSSLNSSWFFGTAQAASFLPATKIPYEYLRMANGDVNLSLQTIIVQPSLVLSDVQTRLTLNNGVFKADIKNMTAGNGKISGTVDINAKDQTAAANLKGTNITLQDLYTDYANANNTTLYIKSGGLTNALINITTRGANTDAYLANMNGQIIALTDKSVVKIKSLERLQGNIIMQILQNLKINITNKEMTLKCAVVRTDIQKGRMNFPKGLVFDANDLYLVADGHINLGDEKINLAIQPFSGKITDTSISSILGSLLKIKGTIANPQLSINQVATAKSVIGAITTAGAYNVGDMMLSADRNPCHTALAGTAYADYFKANTTVRGSVSKGYEGAQDAVKNMGKNLKNSAKQLKNSIKGLFQ